MVNHTENFNDKKYKEILNLIIDSDKNHVEINFIMNKIYNYSFFNNFLLQIKKWWEYF